MVFSTAMRCTEGANNDRALGLSHREKKVLVETKDGNKKTSLVDMCLYDGKRNKMCVKYCPGIPEFSFFFLYTPLCSPRIHSHNHKTIIFFLPISLHRVNLGEIIFWRQFAEVTREQTSEHGHLLFTQFFLKTHTQQDHL